MAMQDAALTAVLKRDRVVVLAALALTIALAWAWLATIAADMHAMPSMAMDDMGMAMAPGFVPWTFSHAAFVFCMWAVMMVGMMTPSAAPMLLLYAQVARQAQTLERPFASTAWFAGGYLSSWFGFAALAAAGQYGLERAALISPMALSLAPQLGGIVLILAGLYQWLPLKNACLAQCRAPLSFIQQQGGFRPDGPGSLRLGVRHGLYCIGCCWALMALLFVGGVMNFVWIAALSALVLAEKIVPGGRALASLAGGVAIAAGVWMLAA